MVKKLQIGHLKSATLTVSYQPASPNLIGLWAGEASCQRPTTSRQSSSEGRAAVGQEGLQVAREQALSRTLTVYTTLSFK